ncbi:abortive infection protein [Cronobacter sakazakii]|nr:abortive infection protein [Cronobacter sakazakii]
MKNLFETEGTVLFPFQTEIHFVWTIYTTAKNLFVSAWGHIGQKQYWSACLCIGLLMAYVGLCAAVVWAVVPWLKAFIVSKLALSALWTTPVKSGLLWGIGKMVGAICRKYTLLS